MADSSPRPRRGTPTTAAGVLFGEALESTDAFRPAAIGPSVALDSLIDQHAAVRSTHLLILLLPFTVASCGTTEMNPETSTTTAMATLHEEHAAALVMSDCTIIPNGCLMHHLRCMRQIHTP